MTAHSVIKGTSLITTPALTVPNTSFNSKFKQALLRCWCRFGYEMSHLSPHVTAVALDVNGYAEYEPSGQLKVRSLRK